VYCCMHLKQYMMQKVFWLCVTETNENSVS